MPATVVLSDFDLPTRSATGWLLRWILPRLEPVCLYAILAHRLPFRLSAPQSDIIIGVGHGSHSSFSGQNEAEILEVGKYDPKEVRGKVIKLISCQTGVALAPDLVRNGALAVLGYTDDFIWVSDADLAARPWADKVAGKVLGPVVDSINALLDGKTAGEALAIELEGYSRNAEGEEDELVRSCIEFNRRNSVLLGNGEARVRSRPKITFPVPPPPMFFPII